MTDPVPFYRHDLSAADAAPIAAVLDSLFLTTGPVARSVEAQIADFFTAPGALLVNSWTNGALAALLALDIGPGDAVIVPAMTFIATANVVKLLGATPVLVDVDPGTLMLTPEIAAAALTANTRAVIPVHLYGQMADVKGLRAALPPDVAIIEDAAHCFEGSRDGDAPGIHSDAAIFSFYATKNVTCGEGGAIISRNPDLLARIAETRTHGMSKTAIDRFAGNAYRHWDQAVLGVKANLPDLLAALLPGQIATIRDRLPRRAARAARYRAAFADGPLRLPQPVPGGVDAHHLFTIHVPPPVRDAAIDALNAVGIQVTVNYRAVHTLSYWQAQGWRADDLPVAADWGDGTISLPFFPSMTDAEQDRVIDAVRRQVYPLIDAARCHPAPNAQLSIASAR